MARKLIGGNSMETIIYRGNQIRNENGKFTAYVMNRYCELEEYTCDTLVEAKAVIDYHIKGQKK